MLTVRPLSDPSKATEVCRFFGKELRDGEMAYYAAEVEERDLESTDNLLGLCVFTLKNGQNEIVYLEGAEGTDDTEALIIMGRAVMSFMHRCSIKVVRLSSQISDDIADSLGFTKNGNERAVDLDEFYESPCGYLKKNSTGHDK